MILCLNLNYFLLCLKFLGASKSDANLSIKRNSEFGPNPILTSDTRMMLTQKYNGSSNMDKVLSESYNREFGHLENRDCYGRIKF